MKGENQFSYIISKYGKMLILLGLLIIIAIPMIEMMYVFGVMGLIDYVSNKVTNTTGVNQYLAKAIIVALMVPLLVSAKWTFSLSSQKRIKGYSVVAFYTVIFYMAMFVLTKDQWFNFATGESMKYCAMNPESIHCFDKPGYDPETGQLLVPATPELAAIKNRYKHPTQKVVNPKDYFNSATGDPAVWYYETPDGTIELFDHPGFHPQSGQALKPITREVAAKYEKQEAKRQEQQQLMEEHRKQQARIEEERMRKANEQENIRRAAAERSVREQIEAQERLRRAQIDEAAQLAREKLFTSVSVQNKSSILIKLNSGEFSGIYLSPGQISEPKNLRIGTYTLNVSWNDIRGQTKNTTVYRNITQNTSVISITDKP